MKSPDKDSLLFEERFMNEKALLILISLLDCYEETPKDYWPEYEKDNATFSRCTIERILDLVWDHPWSLASETVEVFAIRMESYIATAKTEKQRHIFSIAAETAWEVLDAVKEVEW